MLSCCGVVMVVIWLAHHCQCGRGVVVTLSSTTMNDNIVVVVCCLVASGLVQR